MIGKLKKKANISRIMIHSSSSIESAISMLTCTKLGIFFCVIYKDLETEAINKRISIFKPDLILSSVQKKLTNINLNKNKILYFKDIDLLKKLETQKIEDFIYESNKDQI